MPKYTQKSTSTAEKILPIQSYNFKHKLDSINILKYDKKKKKANVYEEILATKCILTFILAIFFGHFVLLLYFAMGTVSTAGNMIYDV